MDKKVRMLSGGERAKLALAVFECENGNFLILRRADQSPRFARAGKSRRRAQAFDGTILFVSHDRYFIQALAGKIVELSDGKAVEFKGTYDEYNAFKAALKDGGERPAPQKAAEAKPKESGYRTKEERAAETKKRLRVRQIEEEISALETEEAEINSQLALPEIAGNYELLKEKCARLEEVKKLLDGLYEEYETLID